MAKAKVAKAATKAIAKVAKKVKPASIVRRIARRRTVARVAKNAGGSIARMAAATPSGSALVALVGPGVAGYGISRLLSRVVKNETGKRWPRLSKHATAGTSLLTVLLAYALTQKIKRLNKYQAGALVGTGIAAIQTLVQTYMPGLAWIFELPSGVKTGTKAIATGDGFTDPPDEFVNDEEFQDSPHDTGYASVEGGAVDEDDEAYRGSLASN